MSASRRSTSPPAPRGWCGYCSRGGAKGDKNCGRCGRVFYTPDSSPRRTGPEPLPKPRLTPPPRGGQPAGRGRFNSPERPARTPRAADPHAHVNAANLNNAFGNYPVSASVPVFFFL